MDLQKEWRPPVTLRSGPALVVASGTATTFGGHPLLLRTEVDGVPLEVELAFSLDPGAEGPQVLSEPTRYGFCLRCVNFDAGRGTAEPVLLRESGDDLVFLHFYTFRYGTSIDTTVQFTLFRVAKAAVGWIPTGS